MNSSQLFYPILKRRISYSVRADGNYYSYNHYREEIREDCLNRCVYCDIHESENGGDENMNLDHFRPKKYEEFRKLENDPNNLVWACHRCNNLKADHWPAIGTPYTYTSKEGFIDPFVENYHEYFAIESDGTIKPLKDPANYMISLLHLNRLSRKKGREMRIVRQAIYSEIKRKKNELSERTNINDQDKAKFFASFDKINELLTDIEFCIHED
jgi:hypothetical protein